MKVLFFNSCKTWGGGEKWHYEMAASLSKASFDVIAVGSPGSVFSKKITQENIPIKQISVAGLSFLNPVKLIRLKSYFRKQQIDAIIINLSADLKLAGIAAKLAGVPHIIYRRGSAIPIKNKALNRFLFGKIVTRVLANSKATKTTVLQNNPDLFPAEKIEIIYNGLHLDDFNDVAEKTVAKKVVLGNLARLSKQKGQQYLINLAEKLKAQDINFELKIGGIGELQDELKAEVNKRKLNDVITFEGFISDPKAFLEQLDIFVFPSIWEGFGFSIIEAKLCKKPVIAFNISSNPEVIQQNTDGYLVEPFNEDAFFEKTLTLIQDQKLRKLMGESGRIDAIQKFSHQQCVNNLMAYLQKLQA